MNNHIIDYGGSKISYFLLKKNRRTMQISVLPDCTVEVIAPWNVTAEQIGAKMKKRAPWILKQIGFFKDFPIPLKPRNYISGETHRYLGKQYRLKVTEGQKECVQLKGGYIYIFCRDKEDTECRKSLLERWYRTHAKEKFLEYVNEYVNKLQKYGIPLPTVKLKSMRTQWGSCLSKKQLIQLNPLLIKVSPYCIEYVIYHELCHLKFAYHDKKYYEFLTKVMPDWKARKNNLEHAEV